MSTANKQAGSMRSLLKLVKRDAGYLLMFLPILAYYLIFHYLPMTGLVIGFKHFVPGHGIYYGNWVGLKFIKQFLESPYAFRLIRNTVLLSTYSIVFGFPIPIIFALCLSEISNIGLKRVIQTTSYFPHFISTVVLVGMMKQIFAVDNGIVNVVLSKLGRNQILFFQEPSYFRTMYIGSGIWQSFGWDSIIYISSITSIDPELYEAGDIDGITRLGKVRHITLPMIAPTIMILLIMRLGSLMSIGFEKVFLMYNSAIYDTADVISTYVYRKGIQNSEFSFATAVGMFNSVVNFALVYASNTLCRKATGSSLW